MIPPFVVVYSPRRTRISLTIRPEDGMLEVRAPEGFPRSRIEAVLARNPELIASLRKRGEAVRRQLPRFRFEEGEFFLLRGRWYPLKFSRRLLCFDEAFLVPAGTPEEVKKSLEKLWNSGPGNLRRASASPTGASASAAPRGAGGRAAATGISISPGG